MHKERINKFRVSLFAVICLFIFVAININYWAASYAESESEWDNSEWYKENCGGLIVSAEFGKSSFSYDKSANLVTIHKGRVTLNNAEGVEKTETSIAIKTNSDNVSDDIKVGLDGVNIESKNCAFDITDDSGNVSIFLLDGSNNTLKSNGLYQPGIRKSAKSGCLFICLDNKSDVSTLTSTGSSGVGCCSMGGHGIDGSITINGGTININGGGGGNGGGDGGRGIGGNIEINGGTVNAINGGAGGGGGRGHGGDGIGGSITINGGTVNAINGGRGGVGIGGSIEINGGSISCKNIERQPVNSKGENLYLATVFNPKGDSIYVNGSDKKYNCPPIHSESDRYLYLYLPNNNDSKLNIKLADTPDNKNSYELEYNFKDGKWEKDTKVFADNYNTTAKNHWRSTYKWDLTKIEPIVLSKRDKEFIGPVGNVQYRFDSYLSKFFKPINMKKYEISNLNLEFDNDKNFLKIGYLTDTPDADTGEGFAFAIRAILNPNTNQEKVIYLHNNNNMGKDYKDSENYFIDYENDSYKDGWYRDTKDQKQRDYCTFDLNKKITYQDNKTMSQIILDKIYGKGLEKTISHALSEGRLTFELVKMWATDE